MDEPKTMIYLFVERAGSYQRVDEYELAALGQIPAVSDLIVDPGVVQGKDRNDPANRSVLEVVARYFLPRTTDSGDVVIHLLVKERQGRQQELDILG